MNCTQIFKYQGMSERQTHRESQRDQKYKIIFIIKYLKKKTNKQDKNTN